MKELREERSGRFRRRDFLREAARASAVLGELDAELREVFPGGRQIVPDDRHVLLDVHDDGGHVGTLVADVLHALPRHLQEGGGSRMMESRDAKSLKYVAILRRVLAR